MNVTAVAPSAPDLSECTNLTQMFYGCETFNANINHWDVSKITNMTSMFHSCKIFNQPLDNWKVDSVTNMSNTFFYCHKFNQNINSWNVGKVTTMTHMFFGCNEFNQPLNSWNVSEVTTMSFMFRHCYVFNQPLNNWNIGKVDSMWCMLWNCYAFNQSLNAWNVSKVENMSHMLWNCNAFNYPLNNWDISSVTNMTNMLNYTALDCDNYAATLQGWSDLATVPSNIPLGAINVYYDLSAETARQNLITNKNWTITDGGECIPLAVTTQPTGLITRLNKRADTGFTVSAVGTGTLTYQWYKNTTPTNTGGTAITLNGTAATYIPPTSSIGKFYYYCQIIDKFDTLASNVATLYVLDEGITTAIVCPDVTRAFSITGVETGLTYQWYSNTTASNVGGSQISGQTNNTFTPPAHLPTPLLPTPLLRAKVRQLPATTWTVTD